MLLTVNGVIAEPTTAETVVAEYVIEGRATAAAFTKTVIVDVSLPVVLDAVIVYVVVEEVDVGVPLIRPVPELILNPAGREGEIDQLVAVPPVFVGDSVLIAVFTSPTISEGEYEISGAGKLRITAMLNVAVELPVVFVAVTV